LVFPDVEYLVISLVVGKPVETQDVDGDGFAQLNKFLVGT